MVNQPSNYNGFELVTICVVFLSLTYVAVLLRIFVRLRITKSFAADDWLMLVAQGVFTLSCAFILLGVHHGIGRHNKSVSQRNEIKALMYQTLATTTYVANMMFIKLSIAIFLLRIAIKRRYIWTLKISMVVIALWSLAIFLYEIFQCTPVQAQWDFTIKNFKCVSGDSFVAAAYSISAMTIVSDWLYAILPIPMIWSVKLTTQAKITVALVLSMGIFASIATLIRLKYLFELADTSDILFTGTTAMVWTLIEPGVAITAASLVTIRPLLRALRIPGFISTPTPHYGGYSGQQSITLRNDVPLGNFNSSSCSSQVRSGGASEGSQSQRGNDKRKARPVVREEAMLDGTGSEEYILQGIRRTVDVTVQNDAAPDRGPQREEV